MIDKQVSNSANHPDLSDLGAAKTKDKLTRLYRENRQGARDNEKGYYKMAVKKMFQAKCRTNVELSDFFGKAWDKEQN